MDAALHARDDAGFVEPGTDGGYVVYDSEWNVYEESL
jgi:hypothetical protein